MRFAPKRWLNWLLSLALGAIVTTAISHLAHDTIKQAVDHLVEKACGGNDLLKAGKAKLKSALLHHDQNVHLEAHNLLDRSSKGCFGIVGRNAEALALLGVVHCRGLGLPKDKDAGTRMVRSARRIDPHLSEASIKICTSSAS